MVPSAIKCFCLQIALHPQTGKPRNFALADFNSAKDAEFIWRNLDGAELNGGKIRIAFGSPGRLGVTIIGGKPFQPLVSNAIF